MAYADLDELIADLVPELKTEEEQAAIGRVLNAASDFADDYCRRPRGYFTPAGETGTERRFKGEGKKYLRIPVHVAGSVSVTNLDGDVISSEAYYESYDKGWLYAAADEAFYPGNAPFLSDLQYRGIWQLGLTYLVTARWGYEATPAAVVEAVRQITVRWYQTQRGVFGAQNITPAGFVVERDIPPSARALLSQYVKKEFEIQ